MRKINILCGRWIAVLLALTMLVSLVSMQVFAEDAGAAVDFEEASAAESFDLYSTSAGGFEVQDGKLVPTGDAGEFKAIYKDGGRAIRAVSVEIHPVGNDGIYAGLYLNASNAANGQDMIDALYLGIESNFPQNGDEFWEDAPNRIDITLGQFAQGWAGECGARFVSETGLGNNLFSGGNKEPIKLYAHMNGNVLTVVLSLVSDPAKAVTTTYTLPEGTDLTLGDVGIRSQYNNAMYDNFTVEYAEEAVQDVAANVAGFENTDAFDLYATSNGSFAAVGGKLVSTGDAGELKAIYKESGAVHTVSVELHPVGNDGPIFGGLYLGASGAANEQDSINALYIGIESNFTGWDDALNRVDLVIGSFPGWTEHRRVVLETIHNPLFSGGIKEPLLLQADISGSIVTVTVSLLRDPSVCYQTVYVADRDVSAGQVGVRSHYNNVMFDNFTVNCAPSAAAAVMGFDNTDAFDLYSTSNGGFAATEGKLVPTGDNGEFKAIYKENGKTIHSVSVEIHPQYTDGPIYGGLYIGASDASNEQDSIKSLYIGIESNFPQNGAEFWEDAPNRIDLVIGSFPKWAEYSRTVSETGLNNNLFSGGIKEPLLLRADISGNTVTATVSLLSDPSKSISATYTADWNLSAGQVGIRSHHNNASYDNFAVNAVAAVNGQGYSTVSQAALMAGENAVTLLDNIDEIVTLRSDVTIDLKGHHINNVVVPEGLSLKLADTAAGGSAIVHGAVAPVGIADGKAYVAMAAENLYTVRPYNVSVNQQVSLGDDLAMNFTVKADEGTIVQVVFAGETTVYDLSTMTADDNGAYTVSVNLAAAQMTEEIKLQFVYGGVVAQENIYSVRNYAQAILTGDYPDKTKNLVQWMLNYGAKAQQYFDVRTEDPANAGYELGEITLPTEYEEMSIDGSISGMSYYGASLVFENKIAVRFYFSGSAEGVSFGDYEVTQKNGKNCIEIAGINPQDYANSITLTATKGEETLSVSYSPLNYIIRMSEKGNASLKTLVNALYGYHTAALRYVNEQTFFGITSEQFNLNSDTGANTGITEVRNNGIAQGYVKDFKEERFHFQSDFHINSTTAVEENPKFGMFVESGNIRVCFYVDMATDLTATTVGCVTCTDGVYDWDNCTVKAVEGMQFSGEGETVTLGVLKNGAELCFYVNDTYVMSYTSGISGEAAAGVFGFNTGMTLSRYFTQPADLFEQEYTFETTKTYRNGQNIEGQWGVGEYTNGGEYGIGDPFVLRYDGKYYMYPSSGTAENEITGVKVFVSDDLVNWTYEGFALEAEEANQAYAPEVLYYNGVFYMCLSGNGGEGHYIYKSQSPTGPFERITDNFGYNIDGSLWMNDNAELYFLYAQSKSIRIVPVDEITMMPQSTEDAKVMTASLDGKWVEGPGLFRRGDYLYLTYSGNKVTEDNYRIGYSYLKGSDPMGDFIQPADNILILETGPDNFRGLGHNSNVVGPNLDSWYAAYHNLVSVDGPQRRYMLDKLVTNGSLVLANGPTWFEMPVPGRPDFETRGTDSMTAAAGLFLSGSTSEKVYTVEFNLIPATSGISSMLFGYVDENNYCEILWNNRAKTLTLYSICDGEEQLLGSEVIDDLAAGVLHTVRIEQGASRLLVYMDSMRKLDVQHTGAAGQIGVTGSADWSYMAFSNDAFGTGDFETVKVAGGAFPAVHYLKGENRGFFIANAQVTGGIRQGEKESTVYHEETGIYDLKLDTAGDWVKYAIRVSADGQYDLSAYMNADCAGATFQVIVDSKDVYELTVPATDVTAMAELLLGQLNLTAGNHTLKIRLLQGSLQVQTFALQEAIEE